MRSVILTFLGIAVRVASFGASSSQLTQSNSTGGSNSSWGEQGLANNVSHLLSEIPIPSPNQTLGSYVDLLLGTILGPRDLIERHLIRTGPIMTSTWGLDQGYFNISLDRCLEFSTIAGVYTSKDGTRYNATLLDINEDLRYSHLATRLSIEQEIASRVLDNAQRATAEGQAYLETALCDIGAGIIKPHDELRRLLAPDGFWVALVAKSMVFGTVGASVYTGILNRNASVGQAIGVTISAAGLTIMDGIIGRLQGAGRLSFLEATIINCFTAWYRRAIMIGVDSQESLCTPPAVVHDALAALPVSSDSSFYFDALSEIEITGVCTNV